MFNDSTKNAAHANESFQFAQLSDPHLSSPGAPFPWQIANKRFLGYLSWLRKRRHIHKRWVLDLALEKLKSLQIDHYVITGDLTHLGLSSEFEQVSHWLQQIGDARNVTLIPGNHDLYVNELWNRTFSIWKNYLDADPPYIYENNYSNNALQRLKQIYPIVRIRKNVAFIGISSIFAAPWFRATGIVNQSQLERLTKLLQSNSLKSFCKVLLIHHPISINNISSRKRLLNHQQLSEIISNLPVQLVLHGHGHNSCMEMLAGKHGFNIPVIGAASSSSVDQAENRKAEFLLFDVIGNDNEWEILARRYNLSLNEKQFIETKSELFKLPTNP